MQIHSLFDCKTQDQCCDYFNAHRQSTPQQDATFALEKMHETNPFLQPGLRLSTLQVDELEQLADCPEPTQDWAKYCSILTLPQIYFVGW